MAQAEVMANMIPYGMSFEHALRLGYTGRIESDKYIAWIKSLDCDTCGAPGPSDPSHMDNYHKGMGSKLPDFWAIPECRRCHNAYEGSTIRPPAERRLARVALYLLWAIYIGVLKVA